MPTIKKHQEKRALVEQLIKEGLTKKEISEKSEIPYGSLPHYLRMWGLKIREPKENLIRHPLYHSKYNHFKDGIVAMINEGCTLSEISQKLNMPRGSLGYLINSWNLEGISLAKRGKVHTTKGLQSIKDKVKTSHINGRPHHFEGLLIVRGQWVSAFEVKEELEYFIAQDIFIREMAEVQQVDPKTISNRLRQFGLQQGQGRRGSRNKWWRGGHEKYRGSDWYEARQKTLERDNHTCQICGITEVEYREKSGRGLSVHHLEPYYYNHQNLVDNLETLCQPCHIKLELENGRFAGQIK